MDFDRIARPKNTPNPSKQNKNEFQTLVEKTKALIFIFQEDRLCYLNPVAKAIMGYSQLSIDTDFYRQLNLEEWKQSQFQPNYAREIQLIDKKGQEYWLDCGFEMIQLNNKPATMVTAFDVTKYKQALAKINCALTTEKEYNESKAHFVAMISHEFRTPLNIISFSTSLLKRHLQQWTKEQQLKYLDRLQTSVEQLSHLMDEVLIIGRAEAGKLKFNPQPLDLFLFCEQLLTEINFSNNDRSKINFVNRLKRKTALIDNNLLKIVLINLLTNAVKYSPSDSQIDLVISSEDKQLIFQIRDYGIGIALEEQSKIFEPFHRSNNVGNIPGNGLGLAIAQKLVELQNGKIDLDSKLNAGTTFTVKLFTALL